MAHPMNTPSAPVSAAFVPSAFQQAIYDEVSQGKGHLVVIARAGAGKTSTTIEALRCCPKGATIALFKNRLVMMRWGKPDESTPGGEA